MYIHFFSPCPAVLCSRTRLFNVRLSPRHPLGEDRTSLGRNKSMRPEDGYMSVLSNLNLYLNT